MSIARRGVAGLLAAIPLAACAALGGVRPSYGPLPGSVTLQFDTAPDAVIQAADGEVRTAGLRVLWSSPPEGYLETDWFDLATRQPTTDDFRDLDRVVKLRFFADPVGGKTRLIAECVSRLFYDPSRPGRELERVVPDGHPGRELLELIVTRLRQRLGT